MVTKLGGKLVRCYTGKDTNTYIAEPVMKVLVDWVMHKILMEDKRLNWLLKNSRNKEIAKVADRVADTPEQRQVVQKIEKNAYSNKSSKITLGDIDVLKQLQEKLQKEEESKEAEKTKNGNVTYH